MKRTAALLTALGLSLPVAADAQEKAIADITPSYNNEWSADSKFLYNSNLVSLGIEHFYFEGHKPDVASTAVRVAHRPLASHIYINSRGNVEGKLVYTPIQGLNLIGGIGEKKNNEESIRILYFSPELVLGGYDNPEMLAAGLDALRQGDSTKIGGLLAGKYKGVMAGISRTHAGWRSVAAYTNKDGPAVRYFLIDDDNFRRDEFIATTRARGLHTFPNMQALRGLNHNMDESVALGNANPFRFAATDLDGRGKGVILGLVNTRTPDRRITDAEAIAYMTEKFWLGGGYRSVEEDGNTRNQIRITGGYTPDFYYSLKDGDIKFRAEFLYDLDLNEPYFSMRFIRIF